MMISNRNPLDLLFDNHFVVSRVEQTKTPGAAAPVKVASTTEFKERAAFNRRRGAMRRRVHQVNCSHTNMPQRKLVVRISFAII